MFFRVLYISLHRYDYANFYPTSYSGHQSQVGEDAGAGFNVNIPWNMIRENASKAAPITRMGDAEYLSAFQQIILPIVYEVLISTHTVQYNTYKLVQYNALRVSLHLTTFQTQFCPELVLVSAGFDGARDDPLGGCLLTSVGYAHMTHELCAFAGGRVVLALEGGYNLQSTSECFRACVSQLLGDPAPLPPDNPIPNDRYSLRILYSLIIYCSI